MKLSELGTSHFKVGDFYEIAPLWRLSRSFFHSLNKISSYLFSIYIDSPHSLTKCLSFNSSQHLKAQLSFESEKDLLLLNLKSLLTGQRGTQASSAPRAHRVRSAQGRMWGFYLGRPHGQHWASNAASTQWILTWLSSRLWIAPNMQDEQHVINEPRASPV